MQFFSKPQDEDFNAIRAEISFVSDLQIAIENAMESRGLSQADLARLMKVTEARISQILSDNGANLRARTIARIAHALDAKACIAFENTAETVCAESLRAHRLSVRRSDWGRSVAANENVWEQERAATAVGGR